MLYNRGESHLYTEPSESAGSDDYCQPCEEVSRCEFVFDSTEQQKCNILTKTSNMAFFSKLWQRPQEKQAATTSAGLAVSQLRLSLSGNGTLELRKPAEKVFQ